MNTESTVRRSAVLAVLMSACLLASGRTTSGQTKDSDTLNSLYEGARIEIGLAYVQREQDSLKQYGKGLDALLVALKKKGDLKTYLVVETEKNRLSAEGTVPPAMGYIPVLAEHVKACRQAVAESKDELNRQTVALLKKYVAALDGRIRQLMLADQIEESKTVMAERNKVVLELTDLEAKLRKEVQLVPVAVAVTEAKPPKKLIPKDAKWFKNHHYLFVTEKMSWQEAKAACEEMDGHLVTITSKEENEFVFKLTHKKNTWIGCTDEKKEGDWEWVTGEKFFFKHWADGEPDNVDNADYGHFWDRYPSHWGDTTTDSDPYAFVCEWDR